MAVLATNLQDSSVQQLDTGAPESGPVPANSLHPWQPPSDAEGAHLRMLQPYVMMAATF